MKTGTNFVSLKCDGYARKRGAQGSGRCALGSDGCGDRPTEIRGFWPYCNAVERRSGRDRRESHIPFYKMLFFKGKRREIRRADDRNSITVLDQYKPPMLVPILIVLCFSLLDAVLTLTLLERGAVELNPVMRYYIGHGPVIFITFKYGLTALALFIVVVLSEIITKRYRIGSLILPLCGVVFGAVIVWELYLLNSYKLA